MFGIWGLGFRAQDLGFRVYTYASRLGLAKQDQFYGAF